MVTHTLWGSVKMAYLYTPPPLRATPMCSTLRPHALCGHAPRMSMAHLCDCHDKFPESFLTCCGPPATCIRDRNPMRAALTGSLLHVFDHQNLHVWHMVCITCLLFSAMGVNVMAARLLRTVLQPPSSPEPNGQWLRV